MMFGGSQNRNQKREEMRKIERRQYFQVAESSSVNANVFDKAVRLGIGIQHDSDPLASLRYYSLAVAETGNSQATQLPLFSTSVSSKQTTQTQSNHSGQTPYPHKAVVAS